MKLHSALVYAFVGLSCSHPAVLTGQQDPAGWPARITKSFLAMHPDSINYRDEEKSRKWNYEQGVMLEALYQSWLQSKDPVLMSYIRTNLDYYVGADGGIATYDLEDFNLDNIPQGRAVLRQFEMTGESKYKNAADILCSQLKRQPRTKSGGFWHKKIYPFQMWLDGLYMAEPFYANYARMFKDTSALDDITHQFLLIQKNNIDTQTGLYYHGWDESRSQRWANQKTGVSPNFWGRSIGWLCMALVDVLEQFPDGTQAKESLVKMLSALADAVWNTRDKETNLWYQILDRRGEGGNYREASASAMFAYAFAKGARLGYLSPEFGERAQMSFDGILQELVSVDERGIVHLHQVCKVSGLGGNPYRDGSYEYYVGEPQRTDDFKGYGPFLLAAVELERRAGNH